MADDKQEKLKKERRTKIDGTKEVAAVKSQAPWPYITVGVFITVVLAAIALMGWAWMSRALDHVATRPGTSVFGSDERIPSGGRSFGGGEGRGFGGMRGFSSIIASGVVTKIDGGTITIAGRGEQVTVKKTSNTVISGDETSLGVNDTVLVMGESDEDDNLTATRIIVQNDSFMQRGFREASRTPDI